MSVSASEQSGGYPPRQGKIPQWWAESPIDVGAASLASGALKGPLPAHKALQQDPQQR
jgi:hypothetical protein